MAFMLSARSAPYHKHDPEGPFSLGELCTRRKVEGRRKLTLDLLLNLFTDLIQPMAASQRKTSQSLVARPHSPATDLVVAKDSCKSAMASDEELP